MAYATPSDLTNLGLSPAALVPISSAQQLAALQAASDTADSYMRSRVQLPLSAWSEDLTRAVCQIAAYDLLVVRGFNPEAGADPAIEARAESARQWLRDVAKGLAMPGVTDSSPAGAPGVPTPSAQPEIVSASPVNSTGVQTRGW